MNDRAHREKVFAEQLAEEVARNKDAIEEIFHRSKVGNCGGKCKGFKEKDLNKLCPQCFQALEKESDEIFSSSPLLRLFGDTMNTKS